jgi:hypothetical protein
MTIANATVCDDLAFDSVFDLRGDAALTGNEERPAAVEKAVADVRTLITSILDRPVAGGHRTKAAKQPLGRLHSHVKGLLKSRSIDEVLPLLHLYVPVFRPLLPHTYDAFAEHALTSDFSYSKEEATAIATGLSRRM